MSDRSSVLIIDDDPDFSQALSAVLSQASYTVSHASSVSAAQALLAKGQFNVVVVDLNLADESGFEIIRQLGLRKRPTQIVATTGGESDQYLDIALWVGAHVTVRKFPRLPDGSFPAEEWKRTIAALGKFQD